MRKPTPHEPWQEAALDVDGQAIVVAVIRHHPGPRTDLFVDGRSLVDGRTLAEARAIAPAAVGGYEAHFPMALWGVPAWRPFLPRWMLAAAVAASVALIAVFGVIPHPTGVGIALVFLVASILLFLIWFRAWTVFAERVHAYLVRRPELGDRPRLALWFGAFIAYGVLPFVFVGLIVLVSGLFA
jgi:hypothetical protein